MAKFEFKLEPLLKLRTLRQDQAERELARRVAPYLHHRRQVESLDDQIDEFYRQVRAQAPTGTIRVDGLIADRRYLNHLHQLRHQEGSALASHRQRVEQARNQLVEAKKQTDMILKLKERLLQRFQTERRRRETIELDDLTGARMAGRMRSIDADEGFHENGV